MAYLKLPLLKTPYLIYDIIFQVGIILPPTRVLGGSKSKTDVIFGFAIPENIEINIHLAIWQCLNFVVCVLSYSSTVLNQFMNNKTV